MNIFLANSHLIDANVKGLHSLSESYSYEYLCGACAHTQTHASANGLFVLSLINAVTTEF